MLLLYWLPRKPLTDYVSQFPKLVEKVTTRRESWCIVWLSRIFPLNTKSEYQSRQTQKESHSRSNIQSQQWFWIVLHLSIQLYLYPGCGSLASELPSLGPFPIRHGVLWLVSAPQLKCAKTPIAPGPFAKPCRKSRSCAQVVCHRPRVHKVNELHPRRQKTFRPAPCFWHQYLISFKDLDLPYIRSGHNVSVMFHLSMRIRVNAELIQIFQRGQDPGPRP